MKFKFETGEVIECSDEAIANLLRADKRYKEVKAAKGKGKAEAEEDKEDEEPVNEEPNNEEEKVDAPEGDDSDAEVQE